MPRSLPWLVLALFAAGCVSPKPLHTPSGTPEIVVGGAPNELVHQVLAEHMAEAGFELVMANRGVAIFERPDRASSAFLFGAGWSTDADLRATVCLLDQGPRSIHVLADLEIVTDKGTASERRRAAPRGHDVAHELQAVLRSVKGAVAMRRHELEFPEEDPAQDRFGTPEVWTGEE